MWSFGVKNMQLLSATVVGIECSLSLNGTLSPLDLTSTILRSDTGCRRLHFSYAPTLIVSAVALTGNRNVQNVWSAQYTRNITETTQNYVTWSSINEIIVMSKLFSVFTLKNMLKLIYIQTCAYCHRSAWWLVCYFLTDYWLPKIGKSVDRRAVISILIPKSLIVRPGTFSTVTLYGALD